MAIRIGCNNLNLVNWEMGHSQPAIRFIPKILKIIPNDPRKEPSNPGEKLIRIRSDRGWSQKEFAAKIDVDPSTLAGWERNEKVPQGDCKQKLNKALSGLNVTFRHNF